MPDGLDNPLKALLQNLKIDSVLGVQSVPIDRKLIQALHSAPAPRQQQAGTTPARTQTPAPQQRAAIPTAPQAPVIHTGPKADALKELWQNRVAGCQKCSLSEKRQQIVFGQGNPDARLVFVGEAPGADEDRTGIAFVGKAGQLLTRMIAAMGLPRESVYICNVLKCRPPNNRDPAQDEISACSPYLMEQLTIIKPDVIIALGAPAAKTLLRTSEGIGRLRGRFHDFSIDGAAMFSEPIPLMPTYHPAYLLRSPGEKAKAWSDLQMVMQKLGLKVPGK